MPAALTSLRPVGPLPTGVGWCRSWVVVLLAVLALTLCHGLEGESPAGHLSAGVHAATADQHVDHDEGHASAVACDTAGSEWAVALPVPLDGDGHGHGGHACLAAGPAQAPPLPGLWLLPAAAAVLPEPVVPVVESAHRTAGGGPDRPASGQVLRI
ncbi:hypothetical protein [Kitasatospora sp. DSM 101779]|uniref:hypothetical protein n=1 Tax=Kitasatospora sp. DSM 101779 TaxID=2853165 RepID=UPI0021D9910A|nr:hypothetical protein [Kitasatospora sp. DSM 101779]MCU7820645.1 hypothetical protein [Kitasatospora sp. DSM 101779]